MGNDMRGSIASMGLLLGVVTAAFVTAASETGSFPLEEKANSSSASPAPSKSETPMEVNTTPSPKVSNIRIEPVAYSKSIAGTKAYAKSKLKKKFPRSYTTQYNCLVKLWNKESRWKWNADNPYSAAYGIPQANPGSKMKSAGRDWKTNPHTQVRWGLDKYIYNRYGTPCKAWDHSKRKGWY